MHDATVQAIDSELKALAADERRGLLQFLRRLDLLDREGGFELFKCGSAYEYLVREHHLPEGTAWRRVNAMKLLRRFPVQSYLAIVGFVIASAAFLLLWIRDPGTGAEFLDQTPVYTHPFAYLAARPWDAVLGALTFAGGLFAMDVPVHINRRLYEYDHLARPFKIRPCTADGMPEHSEDFRTWTVRVFSSTVGAT